MADVKIDKNTCVCGSTSFTKVNMFQRLDRIDLVNSGNAGRWRYDAKACDECGTVKFIRVE